MGAVGVNIQLRFCIHSYVSNLNTEIYCGILNFKKRQIVCSFIIGQLQNFQQRHNIRRKCHRYIGITFAGSILFSFSFLFSPKVERSSLQSIVFCIYIYIATHLYQLSHPSPTNLATNLHQLSHPSPNQLSHPSPSTQPPLSINLATHFHQLRHPSPPTQPPISSNLATHLHQLSNPSLNQLSHLFPPTYPPISTNLATHLQSTQPPISTKTRCLINTCCLRVLFKFLLFFKQQLFTCSKDFLRQLLSVIMLLFLQ